MGPQSLAAVTAISAIVGTAATVYSTAEAGDAAKKIAAMEADRRSQEAEETARRAGKEKARELALGRARAAASGVGGKSTDLYLEELERTRDSEIAWIRKAGASGAAIDLKRGESAKESAYWSAGGQLASGIANTSAWYSQYTASE